MSRDPEPQDPGSDLRSVRDDTGACQSRRTIWPSPQPASRIGPSAAARKAAPHTVLTTNADYRRVPRYRYRPEFVNYERQSPDWVRAVAFGTGCPPVVA